MIVAGFAKIIHLNAFSVNRMCGRIRRLQGGENLIIMNRLESRRLPISTF